MEITIILFWHIFICISWPHLVKQVFTMTGEWIDNNCSLFCSSSHLIIRPSSVRPSFRPFAGPSRLSIHPSIHPSIRPSVRPSVRPSIHPSIHPSCQPSVRSFVRSFVHSLTHSLTHSFIHSFIHSFRRLGKFHLIWKGRRTDAILRGLKF